jgi:hypothetical protein
VKINIYTLTVQLLFSPAFTVLYFYRDLDPGDISEQIALRKKLECKPFKWFMQEVAFDLYKHYPPIDPPDFVHGEIRYGTVQSFGSVFFFYGSGFVSSIFG